MNDTVLWSDAIVIFLIHHYYVKFDDKVMMLNHTHPNETSNFVILQTNILEICGGNIIKYF